MEFPPQLSVQALNQEHDEYSLWKEAWHRFELLNESGERLRREAHKFLVPRPKEPADLFDERVKRFTYQPILSTIMTWYNGKLYQQQPQIEITGGDEQFWIDFQSDCDLNGTSFVDFDRQLQEDLFLYGRAFSLVDLPRVDADDPPQDKAEQMARGLDRPYLVRYEPEKVINWSKDAYGKLEWAVIRCLEIEQETPFAPPTNETYWYIFDRKNYAIYKQIPDAAGEAKVTAGLDSGKTTYAELQSTGPHALAAVNRVPLRWLSIPKGLWMTNRAYLHLLDYLDTENTYSWKLFMSNLAMLVISGQSDLAKVLVSEVEFLHLTDPGAKAEYLQPDASTFKESRERLDDLREEIYRSFCLQSQGRASSATASASSGASKREDRIPSNDMLNQFGDVRRAQMQIILGQDVADARHFSDVEVDVTGFRFEKRSALEDIATAQAALDLGIQSETLERHIDERTAMSLLDDANEAKKKTVRDEIAAGPSRAEQVAADKAAQVQAFGASFQKATAKDTIKGEQAVLAA